ncbi:uncharacterized protein EI90DRAFT_3032118 [Cantharellus anzutake]|uniref:uncharacterized protein n=1 Tax=Cantharellus anzutake TaxID=1750568 RepID=UPI00190321FD|nr:uncharacterized protein EI90DRAFT_3032118 [Cantharellus anzutake]KAF8342096.1 hypothetical protein EI90DRAFT_3032118 [Cantharellus anzutake]
MRFWNALVPMGLLLPIVAAGFHGGIMTQVSPPNGNGWASIFWAAVPSGHDICDTNNNEINKYASNPVALGYPLKFQICNTTVTVSYDLNHWTTDQGNGDCFRIGPDPLLNAGNCTDSSQAQVWYDKFFCDSHVCA